MKSEDLFRAISDLDDTYILEAAPDAEDAGTSQADHTVEADHADHAAESGQTDLAAEADHADHTAEARQTDHTAETGQTAGAGRTAGVSAEKPASSVVIPFHKRPMFRAVSALAAAFLMFVIGLGVYRNSNVFRKNGTAAVQEKGEKAAEEQADDAVEQEAGAAADDADAYEANAAPEFAAGAAENEDYKDDSAAGAAVFQNLAGSSRKKAAERDTAMENMAAEHVDMAVGILGTAAPEMAAEAEAEAPAEALTESVSEAGSESESEPESESESESETRFEEKPRN